MDIDNSAYPIVGKHLPLILKMIKYIVVKYNSDGFGGVTSETKTVSKSVLQKYLNNEWVILEEIIPIITPLSKWWNKFTTNQKISIIAIILPLFFGGLKWTFDTYLNHKYPVLKKDYNSLNDKYHLLKESCNDSINELNKKIESISQELQSKSFSAKTPSDKKIQTD